MSKHFDAPIIGITLGDINGIGPEVIIKALSDNRILKMFTPVIYGSSKTLSYYRKNFNNNDFNYSRVKDDGELIPNKINVINCWEDILEINAGIATEEGASSSRLALQKAVQDIKDGKLNALVTGPINKHTIQSEDFNFPGHTEYLTSEFEVKESLMMLVSGNLRISVVTGHIPLSEVTQKITKDKVETKLKIFIKSLKLDFQISKPRIAVLGLNPHIGDGGLIGDEDERIVRPVVEKMREGGDLVFGPFSSDGFFGERSDRKFDGVLAMYHDQGLIPFKTLAFESGVNFTAGLPIIRTSPDHGTAYSIAGQNIANESSVREALYLAKEIWKNRINS